MAFSEMFKERKGGEGGWGWVKAIAYLGLRFRLTRCCHARRIASTTLFSQFLFLFLFLFLLTNAINNRETSIPLNFHFPILMLFFLPTFQRLRLSSFSHF
ncbi:hypothetical protein ACJW31_10G089200 [Castanea mollissima]